MHDISVTISVYWLINSDFFKFNVIVIGPMRKIGVCTIAHKFKHVQEDIKKRLGFSFFKVSLFSAFEVLK